MDDKDLQLYSEQSPRFEAAQEVLVADLKSVVKALAAATPGKPAIRCRVAESGIKSAKSLFDKAQAKEPPLEGDRIFQDIHDISRATIICNNLNEVDAIVECLKGEARQRKSFRIPRGLPADEREEDRIRNPRPNGYRAYHLLLEVNCPGHGWVVCEIQVKTLLQDSWGALTYEDHYKSTRSGPSNADQPSESALIHGLFRALGDSLAATDQIAQEIRNAILWQEQREWGETPDAAGSSPVDEPQVKSSVEEEFKKKYKVGQKVVARVVYIPLSNYGAIALLDDNTKGLCHISEIAPEYVNQIEDYLKVGERYEFLIKGINPSRQELQLSRREL